MGQVVWNLWVKNYFMLVSLARRASRLRAHLWADLGADLGRHAGSGGLGWGARVHAVGGSPASSGGVRIGKALLLFGVVDELPLLVYGAVIVNLHPCAFGGSVHAGGTPDIGSVHGDVRAAAGHEGAARGRAGGGGGGGGHSAAGSAGYTGRHSRGDGLARDCALAGKPLLSWESLWGGQLSGDGDAGRIGG